MKALIFASLIQFLVSSCIDLGFDLREDPSGSYRFTKFDSSGYILSNGVLWFTVSRDSVISGEWEEEGRDHRPLDGVCDRGRVLFNFIPGCMDCINYANGSLDGGRISGTWYMGFRFIKQSGEFVAEFQRR